jgi:uncharacterized protein YwgA
MGKMSEISIRFEELENNLYNFGLYSEVVIQEVKLLCELGFETEVYAIIYDFENYCFNNQ